MAVNCIAFNHNGNLLVTGAADGIIRLFGKTITEPAHTIPWCDNCLTVQLFNLVGLQIPVIQLFLNTDLQSFFSSFLISAPYRLFTC